jgi:hypothetical protein
MSVFDIDSKIDGDYLKSHGWEWSQYEWCWYKNIYNLNIISEERYRVGSSMIFPKPPEVMNLIIHRWADDKWRVGIYYFSNATGESRANKYKIIDDVADLNALISITKQNVKEMGIPTWAINKEL